MNPPRRHYESYAYHRRNCCRRDLIDERFLCVCRSKPDRCRCNLPCAGVCKWADTYQKETGNKVNYQGIGSSGGVKQIIANTVDFGASDAPLSDEKLAQEGLFQFPTVIGGVVLAVNIPGLKSGELVLDEAPPATSTWAKSRSGMMKPSPN